MASLAHLAQPWPPDDNDEQVEARIRNLNMELEAKSKLGKEVHELRRRLSEMSNSQIG